MTGTTQSRVPLESTTLATAGYDEHRCELQLDFRDGARYQYSAVPPHLFHDLLAAGSDHPLAAPVSRRATADRMLESDRARDRPHHRRSAGVRPGRLLPDGSRSAEHRQFGAVADSALAHVGHAGLPVRFRLSQRQRSRALAAAYYARTVD